jgi:hypothetical protein
MAATEYTGEVIPIKEYTGEVIPLNASVPASQPPVEGESFLDKLKKGTVTERVKSGTILYPEEETFVRKTLQSAASGPLAGVVQAGASMFGYDDVAKKIAQTAKEGNLAGAFFQPEALLTGGAAGKFIGEGAGLFQKGLRAAGFGGVYGAMSAQDDASNQIEGRAKTAATAAAVGFITPAVLQSAAKGIGWAVDFLRGRLADIRAGKVLRDVAAEELPQIQAALASAGDDVTAAQAAAEVGSTKWSALGKRSAKQDSQFTSVLKENQQAAREGVMSRMAGGETAEAAAAARAKFIELAEKELGPRRIVYLAQLATPSQELAEILPKLSSLERQYVTALQNQGARSAEAAQAMSGTTGRVGVRANPEFSTDPAIQELQSITRQGVPVPSRLPSSQGVQKQRDFGAYADKKLAAATESETAVMIRAEADALRQQISELPSAFTAAPVRDAVARQAGEVGSTRRTVANAVMEELRIAGDDPAKIANIRKLGVNQLIGELVQSGKVSKTDAAAALKDIRGIIDKQLGPDFVNKYLEPYSAKLANRDSMALADELRLMLKNNPKKFVAAMRGENPDLVSKYSATSETMEEALGAKRFKLASKAADEIERDLKIKAKAGEGQDEIAEILKRDASKYRIPAFLSWKATVGNQLLGVAEESLNKKTMAKVYNAMRNGKDASALMNELSEFEKNVVLQSLASGKFSPNVTAGVVSGAN